MSEQYYTDTMKSLFKIIKNTLLLVVLFTAFFFAFPKMKELILSILYPCSQKQTFSIVRIDPQFGIATSTVSIYLNQASALWNKAHPASTLLEQVPSGGDISISFVYDERQRATIRNQRLSRELTEQKQKLTIIRNSIAELQTTYTSQKELVSILQKDYSERLNAYNEKVTLLNQQSRKISSDMIVQLNLERQNLDEDRVHMNEKINALNNLATQIESYSKTHNSVAVNTNTIVDKINEQSGKTFEEGTYSPRENTIIIYEYSSVPGLKRVLAHELGHAIGLDHVLGKLSIMYPYNDSTVLTLSAEDKASLTAKCENMSWKKINVSHYINWFTQ